MVLFQPSVDVRLEADLMQQLLAESLVHPRNLIENHRHLTDGPGRRHRHEALNRGVVVLSVAAWQTHVERLAFRAIDVIEPDPAHYTLTPEFERDHRPWKRRRGEISSAVGRLNTPKAHTTRTLLQMVDVDVYPQWTWRRGTHTITAQDARERLDAWLEVRHAIAHGDDDLPETDVLTDIGNGRHRLRRINAEECLRFFEEISFETSLAVFDAVL